MNGTDLSAAPATNGKCGERHLFTVSVPANVLAEFNALPSSRRDPKLYFLENLFHADSVSWTDRQEALFTAGTPYALVIRLRAHSLRHGFAPLLGAVGVGGRDGAGGGPLVWLGKGWAWKERAYTRRRAVTGLRFREDCRRGVFFMLQFHRNVVVEAVEIEVWSGRTRYQRHPMLHWVAWISLFLGIDWALHALS